MNEEIEYLKECLKKAADPDEKKDLLDRIQKAYHTQDSKDFEKEMLLSFKRKIMKDINKRLGKDVAVDTSSMLDNLYVIADRYDEGDYEKVILPTAYMRMLFALKEGGFSTFREIPTVTVHEETVDVTVKLFGADGKQKGIGIAHRMIDRSSFDSKYAQEENAVKLAIGKATADAYRDAGIGIFPNRKEDEEIEEVKGTPAASEEKAVLGISRKSDTVLTSAPVPEKPEEAPVPVRKDEEDKEKKEAVTEQNDMPVPKAIPVPEGYPSYEEALSMESSELKGNTYKALMEKRPVCALICYKKLLQKGQEESTNDEMKALHVIICNTPSLAADCKKWGIKGFFEF